MRNAEYVELDTLLQDSDFISIHVPLLPQTHHLIDQVHTSQTMFRWDMSLSV